MSLLNPLLQEYLDLDPPATVLAKLLLDKHGFRGGWLLKGLAKRLDGATDAHEGHADTEDNEEFTVFH